MIAPIHQPSLHLDISTYMRSTHKNFSQVGRYGCDSLARVFTDNHYVQRDALAFPTKKVGHWACKLGTASSTLCTAASFSSYVKLSADQSIDCAAGKCTVVLTTTDGSAAATSLYLRAAGMCLLPCACTMSCSQPSIITVMSSLTP